MAANRLSIPPEIRREVAEQVAALNALTFSGTPTDAEAEALRDAVITLMQTIFGPVN